MSKCKECGVPLKGLGYIVAWALFMVRPSAKKKGVCNKCEGKVQKRSKSKKK